MDHYQTLQVTRDAEREVIERAYKALSLKYHPDHARAEHQERATRKMQRINEAYRVLRDPDLRMRYDASLGPDASSSGWDQFWEHGLVGLFADKFLRGPRP